jgi:eukaryotic-like serine/threonine-protein kinase
MYCGHKLRNHSSPSDTRTGSFSPTASGFEADEEDSHARPETTPKAIGGYRLLRLLGAGGMGTVYEAEAPGSAQRVAVKLLSSRLASSPASVERFRQEGRLASQLAHPRCVFVLSADTDAGRPYIVMELMPGETLKDIVDKHGPLSPDQAITHILDVIDGLAEAHRVGMIHRDMKPSNCFLTADGRVKVGDFGLSKSLIGSRDQHLTQSGAFLGTVLFASPEQIRGEPLDYCSDVYSVCATLYYLLCGEAPFQHESITAALAKAISEDPPPIRAKRPEVSRGLEAVVMKGLERDRDRRWHTLDDLRDALVALLPCRQHPARPRALVGAYALDMIALIFATVPFDIFHLQVAGLPILLVYFTLGEGVFGATPGKWLLGLRVSRSGQTGPPGLMRALLRTVVFHGLLAAMLVLPEECIRAFGSMTGGMLGGFVVIASAAALLAQVRKRWGYRGVHDLVSGCHVTQQPLPSRKLRLPVKHPTPLAVLLPPPSEPLPASLGGYGVRGRVSAEASGEQVWVGEDKALGRTVLLWLKPVSSGSLPLTEAARPTRLRRLGSGTLTWASTDYEWIAFAAPLGGPLAHAIDPYHPLPWADARHLLDQLVEEFRASETDGTTPARIGLDQVWVEHTGRIQLLECSVPGEHEQPVASPQTFLRVVASLALEGRPRTHGGSIRAPLPAHAIPVLNRLFTDGGYPTLADFQKDLADTHTHRPEVTPAVRAAQLGIQAAVLFLPLGVLFLLTFGLAPWLVLMANTHADQAEAAIAALNDPEKLAELAASRSLAGRLKHPRLKERLAEYRDRKRAEAQFRRPLLLTPQRILLEQVEEHIREDEERTHGYPMQVQELVVWAGATDGTPRAKSLGPWQRESLPAMLVMLIVPVAMVIVAAALRGGVSMILAGISVVRGDGQRATRRQCGLRAAVVWFPITGLLFAVGWLQASSPELVFLAAGLWLIAVALLPVYVVIALRFPSRPPQDRVTGTYLVPA